MTSKEKKETNEASVSLSIPGAGIERTTPIGARIQQVRGNMTRDVFAAELGVSKRTLQRYEIEDRYPDSVFMASLCEKFDVSPSWLLLGEGPMRPGETQAHGGGGENKRGKKEDSPAAAAFSAAVNAPINQALLEDCIKGVEIHLKSRHKTLPLEKKARLIVLLYDLFINKGKTNDATISNYIDIAV